MYLASCLFVFVTLNSVICPKIYAQCTNSGCSCCSCCNQSPVLSDVTKVGIKSTVLTFYDVDFTNHFSNGCNSLAHIAILTLPAHGILRISSTTVTVNQVVTIDDLINLTYTPDAGYIGDDSFSWNGNDGALYSMDTANVNIIIDDMPKYSSSTSNPESILPAISSEYEASSSQLVKASSSSGAISSLSANPASDPSSSITISDTSSDISKLSSSSSAGIFVSSFTKIGTMNRDINFTILDFINNFNGTLIKIKVVALPINGTLNLLSDVVNVGQEIYVRELGNLAFIPYPDWSGVTAFIWNGSNGEVYAENPATVTIEVNGAVSTATSIKPFSLW